MTNITVTEYVLQGARDLITQAERGDLDHANAGELAVWIGKATATMRELTRDA